MNNNDIIRRVRYILDLKDNQITKIFKHVDTVVNEQQVNHWLKREEDEGFVELPDELLIDFLDALIIEKRGKKDGPSVRFKQTLDNNLILMKLKIAFHLKAEDALAIMELAEFKISKHEFSALFRKKDHKHYRVCKNQMLRKFMKGLQIKYRGMPKHNENVPTADVDTVEAPVEKKTLTRKPTKTQAKESSHKNVPSTTEKSDKPKSAASVWKIPSKKK
ncbi:DUF1456 family protein [Marinicella litoralis]|nr:DUF1456 family protein [Marinicella litoralis]